MGRDDGRSVFEIRRGQGRELTPFEFEDEEDCAAVADRLVIGAFVDGAVAAIGGTMLTSPTPLAPQGWAGFGTSTRMGSIIGRSEATGTR